MEENTKEQQVEQSQSAKPVSNNKFLLKNGKQVIDYVDEAGFGLGFAIGNAVRLCYKAGREQNPSIRKQYMDGCSWYIDHAVKATRVNKAEIVNIVTRITSRIEKDQLEEVNNEQ